MLAFAMTSSPLLVPLIMTIIIEPAPIPPDLIVTQPTRQLDLTAFHLPTAARVHGIIEILNAVCLVPRIFPDAYLHLPLGRVGLTPIASARRVGLADLEVAADPTIDGDAHLEANHV
jgi:hypothetical protein